MKDLFGGFYGATEAETKKLWRSNKSVFVFDTNALLLLYRCESETREAFFSQWEKIQDRVWLPYHVCLEYQRNRLTAIKDHVMELRHSSDHISSRILEASDINKFDKKHAATIRRYDSLRDKVSELSSHLQSTVDKFVEEQINTRIHEADFLKNHDTVRDRISELAGNRIGKAPNQENIHALEKIGEVRYSNQIPPGFEDAKIKKEETFSYNNIIYKRKFGDWFIWNEILDYSSEYEPKAVILVTNDNKKDWWFETGGRTRGPLESLKTELSEKGKGSQLLLYSSASFLIAANSHLDGKETSPELIKELERASEKSTTIHLSYKNKFAKNSFYRQLHSLNNSIDTRSSDRYYKNILNYITHLKHGQLPSELLERISTLLDDENLPPRYRDQLTALYNETLGRYFNELPTDLKEDTDSDDDDDWVFFEDEDEE